MIDKIIKDGDQIMLEDNLHLQVIGTPGHSLKENPLFERTVCCHLKNNYYNYRNKSLVDIDRIDT